MSTTTTTAATPVQQAQTQVNAIQDILDQGKAKAQAERKAKTFKQSEYAKLQKQMNKDIQDENDALYEALEVVKLANDKVLVLQLKQQTELNILQIREAYKPQLDALKLDVEDVLEAGGSIAGDFIGGGVAKVTKPVGSFFGSFGERTGLNKLFTK